MALQLYRTEWNIVDSEYGLTGRIDAAFVRDNVKSPLASKEIYLFDWKFSSSPLLETHNSHRYRHRCKHWRIMLQTPCNWHSIDLCCVGKATMYAECLFVVLITRKTRTKLLTSMKQTSNSFLQ